MEEKKSTIIKRDLPPGVKRVPTVFGKPGSPEESDLIIFFMPNRTKSEQPTTQNEELSPQEEFLGKLKSEVKFPVKEMSGDQLKARQSEDLELQGWKMGQLVTKE